MEFVAQNADVARATRLSRPVWAVHSPRTSPSARWIEVRQRDFDMFQQAIVRPTVNFDRLEFVLVIMNFEPLPGQPVDPESVG
jgi:hypothetical protein